MDIPSLQNLCLGWVSNSLKSSIPRYYKRFPTATVCEHKMIPIFFFLEKMERLFLHKPEPIEDFIIKSLPLSCVLQIAPLNPFVISSCMKFYPKKIDDLAWKRMFIERWETHPDPLQASFRDAYLIQHLLDTYQLDFRQAAEDSIALFVKYAQDIECIETVQRTYTMNDKIAAVCIEHCKHIKKIHLRGSHNITEQGLIALISAYPRLKHCKLGSSTITGKIFSALLKCKHLETVDLSLASTAIDQKQIADFTSLCLKRKTKSN